jgi:hypothetical protein
MEKDVYKPVKQTTETKQSILFTNIIHINHHINTQAKESKKFHLLIIYLGYILYTKVTTLHHVGYNSSLPSTNTKSKNRKSKLPTFEFLVIYNHIKTIPVTQMTLYKPNNNISYTNKAVPPKNTVTLYINNRPQYQGYHYQHNQQLQTRVF